MPTAADFGPQLDILKPSTGHTGCGCGPQGCGSKPEVEVEAPEEETAAPPPSSSEAIDSSAVRCPTCDEVFSPDFARHCDTCGHDFGDGRAKEDQPPALQEWNYRTAIVLTAVVAVIGAVVAIFTFAR